MALKFIDRMEIIRKRQALIRQGLRPVSIGYDSSYRMRERKNIGIITPRVISTTYPSRLVSGIYHSVFCQGVAKP